MAEVILERDSTGAPVLARLTAQKSGPTVYSWGECLELEVTPTTAHVAVHSERSWVDGGDSIFGTDELVALLSFVRTLRPEIWDMAQRGEGYRPTFDDLDEYDDDIAVVDLESSTSSRESLTPQVMIWRFEEVFVRPEDVGGEHMPFDQVRSFTTAEAVSLISDYLGGNRLDELAAHLGGRRDKWFVRREVER